MRSLGYGRRRMMRLISFRVKTSGIEGFRLALTDLVDVAGFFFENVAIKKQEGVGGLVLRESGGVVNDAIGLFPVWDWNFETQTE